MSDFFGGILDNLRGVGNDVSGFFDSAIGQAVARAAKGGGLGKATPKLSMKDMTEGFYNDSASAQFSPTADKVRPVESEDYATIEQRWLERMHRFAGLDATNTKVSSGGK